METPKKLSEAQEQKLSDALSKVADYVAEGKHPNDAIYKVATDERIPAGHIQLMVQAYNTGRCLSQIHNGSSVAEKAASFPLASAAGILPKMYPKEPETPAQQKIASVVSNDYAGPPDHWMSSIQNPNTAPMMKAASTCNGKCCANDNSPKMTKSQIGPLKDAYRKTEKIQQEQEAKKTAALRAGGEIEEYGDKLRAYFKLTTAIHPCEVSNNLRMAGQHKAANYLDHITHCDSMKQASVRSAQPVNWDREPYNWLLASTEAMERYSRAKVAYDEFTKTAAARIEETLRPFAGKSAITGSIWPQSTVKTAIEDHGHFRRVCSCGQVINQCRCPSQDKQTITVQGGCPECMKQHGTTSDGKNEEKKADEVTDLGTMGLGAVLGVAGRELTEKLAPDKEKEINKRVTQLEDPAANRRMSDIRDRTMLLDLMTTDPVISGYDPHDVTSAFNHIREVAPRASSQRMAAQALLRKYLAQGGAMDTFDIGNLHTGEKTLAQSANIHGSLPIQLARAQKRPEFME